MPQSGSDKKSANNLVTASCAAVLAVYVTGYVRTQSAANRFAAQIAERRVADRDTVGAALAITEFRTAAPNAPVDTHLDTPGAAPSPLPAISSNPSRDAASKRSKIASAEPMPTTANAADGAVEASPVEIPSPPPVAVIALPEAVQPAPPAAEHKTEVAPAAPPAPMWKDGTYTGWGYSRHGDIEASVAIEGGRIASATISQCRTRYSCSVIDRLPPQVAQRQSPDVDYVSGATQSADAFYGAVVAALNKAK
jgi:uncharacterized protein with FMN-binding domain